jgi:hypothetical protein
MQDAGPHSQSKLCKQVGCFVYMQGEKEEGTKKLCLHPEKT